MSYSSEEVQEAIEASPDFDSWGPIKYEADGSEVLQISLGGDLVSVTKVDDFGGEGKGDEAWIIIQVEGEYYRVDGYYASHYGYDWDGDLYKVTRQEKVVTVYE